MFSDTFLRSSRSRRSSTAGSSATSWRSTTRRMLGSGTLLTVSFEAIGGRWMKIAFFYPVSCYVQSTIMFFFVLRGEAKNLWEKWHNSEIMFHLELGIQSKQGWQFLYYCQNAIEKKCFFTSAFPFSHMFCMYTHIVNCFPRNFWLSLFIILIIHISPKNILWQNDLFFSV